MGKKQSWNYNADEAANSREKSARKVKSSGELRIKRTVIIPIDQVGRVIGKGGQVIISK
jgi:hypothetical protein